MNEDFILLKNKFKKIKNMGLIASLRKGSSGAGYTLETLLHKKEDQECKPDFNSIELKTRMAYSKYPLSLFHCEPKRYNKPAIDYIFYTYCYPKFNDKKTLVFDRSVYSNKTIKRHNYEFKLSVDYRLQCIIMKSYYNDFYIEDVCYWDFKVLENKLKTKLKNLAIIFVYPYKIKGKIYYKYIKINFYKLIGFFEFLELIKNDKIHIEIYLKNKYDKNGDLYIDNHGFAFKIDYDYIEKLFYKVYI